MSEALYSPADLEAAPDTRTGHLMLEIQRRGLGDRAAAFLHRLPSQGLVRYAALTDEARPEDPSGPAPNILTASVESVQDWLYRIWCDEEACFDDPAVPVMPFRDWLVFMSEDRFYRCHIHAKFYLGEAEPMFEI